LDEQPKLRKTDVKFGTWSIRSLSRAGLLILVSREISEYELDLVGIQDRGFPE
jgi:hypothetical protein